jgi:cysteinyl-tRNA synthetase, unknown class
MNYRKILLVVGLALLAGCSDDEPETEIPDLDFREEMREFVQAISSHAKSRNSSFLIIPQNGQELFTLDGTLNGDAAEDYFAAIDGTGREDLFYGYLADNEATPTGTTDIFTNYLQIALDKDKAVLVTDYCSSTGKVDNAYAKNNNQHFIPFAADHRELDNIPAYPGTPYAVNDADITSLSLAKNFLYLINPGEYATKAAFLDAIRDTNYDILLIDLYYDGEALSSTDVASLKTKANGGSRLVICYMSIGEAESYRPYWFLLPNHLIVSENPDWPGNYVVKYWEEEWQDLIYKDENSYTDKILTAGFDGVYLDIIEAYETFE